MEVALDQSMPTYSGGLGVLAGDTLKAAADVRAPLMGITLLYRAGYFRQRLDEEGRQTEEPWEWDPREFLTPLPERASVSIEGRDVAIRPWLFAIEGRDGHQVPVYFLDADLPENDPWDRKLTGTLYGGGPRYRLAQEVILGMGGVAMLRALGHRPRIFHMNEGHSALLSLSLLAQEVGSEGVATASAEEREGVRSRCVFTTHTPVPAGHDRFPVDLVRRVLGDAETEGLESAGCLRDGELNMTYLGLRCSHYVNGVSMRHEKISEGMFPGYPFDSITNGVHAETWTSKPLAELFDRNVPEWRRDNRYLRYAVSISRDHVMGAHRQAKKLLLDEVKKRTGRALDPEALLAGFARRATLYKRHKLIFRDLERLRSIARWAGPMQLVFSGKAHPKDDAGKEVIRDVYRAAAELEGDIPVVYLEDYDVRLGALLTSGVDLWLNTPRKPQEASGTSGMKAALNGVPSLSVLDGWWIEGHVEGVTGWSVGDPWNVESDDERESDSLYEKLEGAILPLFHNRPDEYARVMRSAIALNGSFFNAQRMISQYVENAYLEEDERTA
ncbi:MAG: alpha-glucan family phosphorylase [Candidatus Eisenbacteria bacterium]|nr:alpha-glucan family phosphorylase [Candidatus Eisenbacteria bacterium]